MLFTLLSKLYLCISYITPVIAILEHFTLHLFSMSDNFLNEKLENSEDNHVPFRSILEEDVEGIKQHFVTEGIANINDFCYQSERYGPCTALMIASERGKSAVVRLLLEEIKIACNESGDGQVFELTAVLSTFIIASENGNYEIAELLLDNGAQVDGTLDTKRRSALMNASMNGHYKTAELLLNNGADFDLQDSCGWTALMLASSLGHFEIAKLLLIKLKGALVNLPDYNRQPALMIASAVGWYRVAKLLLDKGAQVDWLDKNGQSALMAASKSRCSSAITS